MTDLQQTERSPSRLTQEDRKLPEPCIQEGWRVGDRKCTYEAEKQLLQNKGKEKKRQY